MCQEWMDIISFCLKEKAGDIILIQSFGIAASRQQALLAMKAPLQGKL